MVNHESICHKLTPNFSEVGIPKTSAASDFTCNESPPEFTYFCSCLPAWWWLYVVEICSWLELNMCWFELNALVMLDCISCMSYKGELSECKYPVFWYVGIRGLAIVLESLVFITACSNHGDSSALGCFVFCGCVWSLSAEQQLHHEVG